MRCIVLTDIYRHETVSSSLVTNWAFFTTWPVTLWAPVSILATSFYNWKYTFSYNEHNTQNVKKSGQLKKQTKIIKLKIIISLKPWHRAFLPISIGTIGDTIGAVVVVSATTGGAVVVSVVVWHSPVPGWQTLQPGGQTRLHLRPDRRAGQTEQTYACNLSILTNVDTYTTQINDVANQHCQSNHYCKESSLQ